LRAGRSTSIIYGVYDPDATAELRLGDVAVSMGQAAVEQRARDWYDDIAEQVDRLGAVSECWSPQKLDGNQAFASALVAGAQAARQTSSPVKLLALRNAVLNSVGPDAPDDDEQALLFGWVSELAPWHLQILAVASDPVGWFTRNRDLEPPVFEAWCTHAQLLEVAIPALRDRSDLYDAASGDLERRGLVHDVLYAMRTSKSVWHGWATPLGQRLIAFITVPRP
jgi:hypothetical protein